mmetsp:Transcript_6669/g.12652  ORF Transcript_6669/g.12652 Transcript_6669/m.12652 type:complete len:82 (-) Transcript_6669:42-287(-)
MSTLRCDLMNSVRCELNCPERRLHASAGMRDASSVGDFDSCFITGEVFCSMGDMSSTYFYHRLEIHLQAADFLFSVMLFLI